MFGFWRRKAATWRRDGGFLGRLARDSRGNTLAIVGAAMIPLAAMIGSGVDMSRAYMAKTRLQTACDAAALAGRRIMQNDTMSASVTTEATRFFNYNFNQGQYGTAAFTPTVTRPAAGTVRVSASTTIPTTIMRAFGFHSLPLNVTCDASLNFVNTDVMLVLDTTGSMNRDVNDNNTSVDANRKIHALRQAVLALYDELKPTQDQLQANGLRLRYGIVPYSSTVNVGNLVRNLNADYIRSSTNYQTREAYYNTPVHVPTDTPVTNTEAGQLSAPGVERFRISGTDRQISNANCTNFGNNTSFSQSGTAPAGGSFTGTGVAGDNDVYVPAGSSTPQANAPNAPTGYTRYQYSRNTATWSSNPANRVCDRNVTITRRTYTTRYSFTSWRWGESTFDTSQLRGGATTIATNMNNSAVTVPTAGQYYNERSIVGVADGLATTSTSWNGCIMERDTTSTINTSTNMTIPTAAYDLNINYIPDSEATRWAPHWPQVTWKRNTSNSTTTSSGSAEYMGDDTGDTVACPSEARRLQAWTRDNLVTYINGLVPRGYTYHDIGMIWGARMLSNGGIFAADNPDTFGEMPVSRHIIFMTDGVLTPTCGALSAWGIEQNDRHVTGTYNCSDHFNRHMQRFHMVCNAARGMGFSVWVIAFGTTLTSDMAACASNPNQASTAADQATLIARFRQIGANIGALRLTQ